MSLGDNIRRYRRKNKMTQTELANKLEKSLRTIQKYESNEIKPSQKTIREIADIFYIDINKLIGIEDHLYNNLLSEYIDHKLSMMSIDDILTLKNQQTYENELENKELLYSKLDPKQLELLYLAKIKNLEELIESKNNEISLHRKLANSQNLLVSQFLNGDNIDDILNERAEKMMYSMLNVEYKNDKLLIDKIINHKAQKRAEELFDNFNNLKRIVGDTNGK